MVGGWVKQVDRQRLLWEQMVEAVRDNVSKDRLVGNESCKVLEAITLRHVQVTLEMMRPLPIGGYIL